MLRTLSRLPRRDVLAFLFLAIFPWVYFYQVTLGQQTWFAGDTVRTYYPLGVELARALNEGRLPLWTPGMFAGFPVLADAQIGALYPLNLFLYKFFPPHIALSYSILFHITWAACGMFLCVRASGLRTSSALLAGFVFAFGGFMLSRLPHVTILLTASWLPWLIFFQNQFQRARSHNQPGSGVWFLFFGIAVGMQFLCGFPQIAFMNMLAVGLIGFAGGLFWNRASETKYSWRKLIAETPAIVFWIVLAVLLGAGLAAIQLLPTVELIGYSVRGEAQSFNFVTSYSLPLEFLTQFVVPFANGEPSEGANNEYWVYLGLLPFVLAILGIFLRRNARTIFFAAFAVTMLSLALGELNPLYRLIYLLPGFNLFRVPARYLFLVAFAGAMLAAIGLEALSNRLNESAPSKKTIPIISVFAILVVCSMWFAAQYPTIEFWMNTWQVLPWVFILASAGLIGLAWINRIGQETFQAIAVGLVLFDLTCAAPLFSITVGQMQPLSYIASAPRSIAVLDASPGKSRVFTDQYTNSSIPAIRASLFPNMPLTYGIESAQAYSSLAFARHLLYLYTPSPAMLNVMNIRYFMVPLEPRSRSKMTTPFDALTLDVLNNEEIIPATSANAIEVVSFTENAENLAEGSMVAQIEVRRRDGHIDTFPIRVGIETADWDYARKNPKYAKPSVAHAFLGFWRSSGKPFDGFTYSARIKIDPGEITGVNVRVLNPDVRLTIERVNVYDANNKPISLAHLAGKDEFSLLYLSDTVAAWENLDVLPRAFLVHDARVLGDGDMLARMHDADFDPAKQVLLIQGSELYASGTARDAVEMTRYTPERASINVATDQPGYLVLADSWYPGWEATIDGKPVPIYRANTLFRAVPIDPGDHVVVFEYHPASFTLGGMISILSGLLVGGIAVYLRRRKVQIVSK